VLVPMCQTPGVANLIQVRFRSLGHREDHRGPLILGAAAPIRELACNMIVQLAWLKELVEGSRTSGWEGGAARREAETEGQGSVRATVWKGIMPSACGRQIREGVELVE
jgi:hypothetical protein